MQAALAGFRSVRSATLAITPVQKGLIEDSKPTWSWKIASEIPVPAMLRHGRPEVVNRLVHHSQITFPREPLRSHESGNFVSEFLFRERFIDLPDMVDHSRWGQGNLVAAGLFNVQKQVVHLAGVDEADGRLEGDEAIKLAHVDAVAVWIHDWRSRTCDDNSFWIQSRQNRNDGLAQCRPADDGVIQYNQGVLRADDLASDVIDVCYEITACFI